MIADTSLPLTDIPFAVFCFNTDGEIIDCNERAELLSGYVKSELIGESVELLVPESLRNSHVKYRKNYQQGSGGVTENRHVVLLNKSKQQIECSIKISENSQGYIAFIGVEQKSILRETATPNQTKKVLNSIDQAYWEWNIDDDIIFYSAQAMFILGYKKEAFTGSRSFWANLVDKKSLHKIFKQVDEHFLGNLTCINPTFHLTTEQGEKRWVSVFGKVFEYKNDKPHKMFGSIKDLSENYILLDKLKKQNSYLHLAESLSLTGHWHFNVKNKSLYWSEGVFQIYGESPDSYQPTLENSKKFYSEEDQKKINLFLKRTIEKKKGFYFKASITTRLNTVVKVESLGKVELDKKGEVIGVFGVLRDITQSEHIFEKLKLLAMVNYTIKVPIFFIDEQDNVVYQDLSPQLSNESAVLFKYINFSISEYLVFKREAKENGQLKKTNISFDKYISVFNLLVTYEACEGIYIWIVENVTEAFRKEQQQVISNRLALLGNTFGNVSHDINNVLGVALGATEMLELKFSQGERDISNYIERVKNAIDKGKSVTERLLAFTRKPPIKVVKFDPMKEIFDNQYIFKQLLPSAIELTLDIENVFCEIVFPQGEFINILLNLVLNAQDAIREKGLVGKIKISANINKDQWLEIHVKDSGIGIENENLTKVFDPFYSSKSLNKGNGIGLANVYSTIYKHNGQIQVEGHCDFGGAQFTLLFKCSNSLVKVKTPNTKQGKHSFKGKRVLILDDEVSIAEFVALYLESEGMITKHVSNKSDLVAILSSEIDFDIFITDMILPDISGRESVDLVLKKFPNISIFSMSGYIAEEDHNWKYPVLRKPFNSKELFEFLQ